MLHFTQRVLWILIFWYFMVKLMKSYVFPTNYMDAVGCGQMRLDVVFSLNLNPRLRRRHHRELEVLLMESFFSSKLDFFWLTGKDMTLLVFTSIIYWRLPSNQYTLQKRTQLICDYLVFPHMFYILKRCRELWAVIFIWQTAWPDDGFESIIVTYLHSVRIAQFCHFSPWLAFSSLTIWFFAMLHCNYYIKI